MPNRSYEKGRRAEYRLLSELRVRGHFVLRSSGSHSIVDVVSVCPDGQVFFWQVKNSILTEIPAQRLLRVMQQELHYPNANIALKHRSINHRWVETIVRGGRTSALRIP